MSNNLKRYVTQEDIDLFNKLIDKGYSYDRISRETGWSQYAIRTHTTKKTSWTKERERLHEKKDEMIALFQNGWTVRDIAVKFGFNNVTVRTILKDNDAPTREVKHVPLSSAENIRADFESGIPAAEIAKKYEIHRSTVYRILSRLNQD